MKRLFSFLAVLVLASTMALPVLAAGSVTYDGDSDRFVFAPGTADSPESLFENFQDVMPGDILTEQIQIRNDTSNGVKIKVYMRSLGAQEGTDDFLSQLTLTVRQKDTSILYSAPANETAQLSDWVYLGTVYSGGEITLDVTLEVPLSMGDEFQDRTGYIDWAFKVEELPVEPSDPKPPQTGDTQPIYLYIILMLLSLVFLLLLLYLRRRKQAEQDA